MHPGQLAAGPACRRRGGGGGGGWVARVQQAGNTYCTALPHVAFIPRGRACLRPSRRSEQRVWLRSVAREAYGSAISVSILNLSIARAHKKARVLAGPSDGPPGVSMSALAICCSRPMDGSSLETT